MTRRILNYTLLIFCFMLLWVSNLNAQTDLSEVKLLHFKKYNCLNIGYAAEKIVHQYVHEDSLFVRVQIEANCSLDILNVVGSLSQYEDTLNLDFSILMPEAPSNTEFPPEPIPEAECDCLFWLDYVLYRESHEC